jgi:hypothetical protein
MNMWVPRWFKWLNDSLHTDFGAIQDALKQQSNAIRVNRESAKNEQNEAARIIAGAINNASNATSGYEQPQRKKEFWLQVALVALTFVAAAGAVAAAMGSWRALPEVKKSADAAQSAATTASQTLCETRRSLQASIDNFHQDQRAWIYVKSVKLTAPYSAIQPGEITVEIANSGKTPGLDTSIAEGGMTSYPYPPLGKNKKLQRIVEPPGSNGDTMYIQIPATSANKIYLRFAIQYWDVFQKSSDPPHKTTFCGFYPTSRPPNFFNCPDLPGTMN